MITVFCGENNQKAYESFSLLKESFKKQSVNVVEFKAKEVDEIYLWQGENRSLFSLKTVFFTENLNKNISKKNLRQQKILEKLIKDKEIEVYDFEDQLLSRDLKFPKGVIVKEFKPEKNIFKLNEAIIPGNFKNFIAIFNQVCQFSDEYFIYSMIAQHVRQMILVKQNLPLKTFFWAAQKIRYQAKFWSLEKLLSLYESLFNIQIKEKTSTNPLSLKKSLEILFSYYL